MGFGRERIIFCYGPFLVAVFSSLMTAMMEMWSVISRLR